MITRFKYVPVKPRDTSSDDIFYKYSYEKKIKVLTKNDDGSVKDYVEEHFWKKEKNSWKEFIDSYDIGSVEEQVINHLTKGTPLVTAHTLPAGDYRNLEKGAEIKREMAQKGITLEMLVNAINEEMSKKAETKVEPKQEVKVESEVKQNA